VAGFSAFKERFPLGGRLFLREGRRVLPNQGGLLSLTPVLKV